MKLQDEVAIVTGASRGGRVGEAVALALAQEGADVVVAARSQERMEGAGSRSSQNARY